MAGWLHGVFVSDWLFVFTLCGFSLSLFCNYDSAHAHTIPCNQPTVNRQRPCVTGFMCKEGHGIGFILYCLGMRWASQGGVLQYRRACGSDIATVAHCRVTEFDSVSFGLHSFLRVSSAGLIVVFVPGCCWAYSACSPCNTLQRGLKRE